MTPGEVNSIVVLPSAYESRRAEVTDAVVSALAVVRDFASQYGWSACVEAPFFEKMEVHETQDSLWQRILELNDLRDIPKRTNALTAALEKGVLLVVVREEAEQSLPAAALAQGL